MENNLSKRGKVLAFWQILAGVVSLVIAVLNFLQVGMMLPGVALMVFAILSMIAGVALLRGKSSASGLSWLTQLVQVPALYLKGFYFQISCFCPLMWANMQAVIFCSIGTWVRVDF